jgi:hypothetical protein
MPVTQIMSIVGRGDNAPPPPPPPPTPFDGWYDSNTGYWYGAGNNLGVGTQVNTVNVGATFPDGSSGSMLTFGSGAYMIGPNMKIGATWTTNAITVDLWFYPTANGVQILSEQNGTQTDGSGYHYSVFEIDSGGHVKARFWDGFGGHAMTSEATVTLNAWNHVYFFEDTQGGHDLQVNGIRNYATASPTYTRSAPFEGEYFCIGLTDATNMGSNSPFQGKIAMLTVHDYVTATTYYSTRSRYQPAQLIANFDASNSTSYPGTGKTWYNLVSGGANATFDSNPAIVNNGSVSIDFAGYNWATMPADIYFKQDFTITAWIRLHSYANWERIIDFGNGAGSNNILLAPSDGTSGHPALRSESTQFTDTNTTLPVGRWVQVTGRVRGDGLGSMFINGSGTYNYVGMVMPQYISRSNCYIGKSNWPDALLNGEIGELQIYDGALSETAILANYNSTKNKYPNAYWVTTAHGLNAGWANSFQGANTVTVQDNAGIQPAAGWTVNDGTVTRTVTSGTIVRQGSAFGPIMTIPLDGAIDDNAANVTLLGV